MHTSYSRVNQYLRCGLAYKFKYELGLAPEFLPAPLIFGVSFHRAVELFFQARMGGRPDPTLDELHTTFQLAWETQSQGQDIHYKDGDDAESQHQLARRMLSAFVNHFADRRLDVIAVEQRASARLARDLPDLLGFLDVIERLPNGSICITEIKTSGRRFPEGSPFDSLQLAAYAAIARNLGHQDDLQVKLVVVTKTKSPVVQELIAVLDDHDISRFTWIARSVHDAVQKGVFVPNPGGWQCASCQWQGACREEVERAA
jgi:putative RecB family exonuclease